MSLEKPGIINGYEVSTRCASSGCLNALSERTGSFERYEGDDARLVSFVHCNGCGEKAVEQVVAPWEEETGAQHRGPELAPRARLLAGRARAPTDISGDLAELRAGLRGEEAVKSCLALC